MTDNTRPDPKVQVQAIFEIGRVMVEKSLPPMRLDIDVNGDVHLSLYDREDEPVTAAHAEEVLGAWVAALGLPVTQPFMREKQGIRLRYATAYGTWAGLQVTVYTSGRVAAVEAVAS